jgi:hypothetical protein
MLECKRPLLPSEPASCSEKLSVVLVFLLSTGAFMNLGVWIIPAHGWRGAAWSSIASDGLLALALWFAASRLARRPHSRCEQAAIVATGPV